MMGRVAATAFLDVGRIERRGWHTESRLERQIGDQDSRAAADAGKGRRGKNGPRIYRSRCLGIGPRKLRPRHHGAHEALPRPQAFGHYADDMERNEPHQCEG
jgi:hypothetical protein